MVMYTGCLVEKAGTEELFARPLHPYTKGLLSAIPIPSLSVERKRILLQGEIVSPINPAPGCRFCSRCEYATEECRKSQPEENEILPGHVVACHRAKEINGL
jgi:peptide/nickel transport system ATP-binding protein